MNEEETNSQRLSSPRFLGPWILLKLIYIVFRGPKKYSEVLSPVKICMVLALDLVRLHLLSRIPFLALDYIDFLVSLPCFPQSFVRLGIFYDFWCLPRAEKGWSRPNVTRSDPAFFPSLRVSHPSSGHELEFLFTVSRGSSGDTQSRVREVPIGLISVGSDFHSRSWIDDSEGEFAGHDTSTH